MSHRRRAVADADNIEKLRESDLTHAKQGNAQGARSSDQGRRTTRTGVGESEKLLEAQLVGHLLRLRDRHACKHRGCCRRRDDGGKARTAELAMNRQALGRAVDAGLPGIPRHVGDAELIVRCKGRHRNGREQEGRQHRIQHKRISGRQNGPAPDASMLSDACQGNPRRNR